MARTKEVRYDATFGDAEIAAAREALVRGDTGPATLVLTSRPTGVVPFVLMALTDPAELDGPALATLDGLDDVPWAPAARAMRRWWDVTILERETAAIGPSVYRHAVTAAHALSEMRGAELPPWFATVALAVETDLGHSHDQRSARFESIVRQQPEDALAWFVYLRATRYEDAIARIDNAASGSRPGSILHALRVVPRLERWRQSDEQTRSGFFTTQDVVRAIRQASAAFLDGPSEPPYALFGHALLAFTTYRIPEAAKATKAHLDAMDNRWTFWPWGMLRRPVAAFEEVLAQHRKPRSFRLR